MNEKQTTKKVVTKPVPKSDDKIRPTKKQHDLLAFIERFIGEHGYSPSYREIMSGLQYTSVATVALHVNSLIKRGHLRKRDRSARSLEVVKPGEPGTIVSNQILPGEEKWLVDKVGYYLSQMEEQTSLDNIQFEQLLVLVEALKVLGIEGAAASFAPRLAKLREKIITAS